MGVIFGGIGYWLFGDDGFFYGFLAGIVLGIIGAVGNAMETVQTNQAKADKPKFKSVTASDICKPIINKNKPKSLSDEHYLYRGAALPLGNRTEWTKRQPAPEFFPACPYCKNILKNKKKPARRSEFVCPHCEEYISVDPHQWAFPQMYLTDVQACYVHFIDGMGYYAGTIGGYDAFIEEWNRLKKKFNGNPGLGDVIWGIMVKNQLRIQQQMTKDVSEQLKYLEADECFCDDYLGGQYSELTHDFRQFEADLKYSRKELKIEKERLEKEKSKAG